MAPLIISVSGLRGIVGESLTPEVAVRYAAAFAESLPPGAIVVTRDGRATGKMLADAVRSALCAAGRNVVDAEIAATPTTGVLVRHHQAAGGIQISASHNPAPYNGLKLFSTAGRVIDAQAGERVKQRYLNLAQPLAWAAHNQLGRVIACENTTSAHLRLVLATVDVARIRAQNFRVLLDANHGAGSLLGKQLLAALGCEAVILGDTPDGQFAHGAEPTAENLREVSQQIVAQRAAIGFCQDPDADRLAVIDERGRYLGEEYTLALCVEHVLRTSHGPIVTNCSTSRMSQDIAEKFGVPFFTSAVGEANVVDSMLAHNALFGGEGNGGPIDPRVGLVRDSFVGMALILDAMSARNLPISALADELPRYEICKTKITLAAEKLPAALAALESHFADAKADRRDGLRLELHEAWLLIRASNTEPIVRIIAEAPSAEEAQRLCTDVGRVIESLPVTNVKEHNAK